jgi:hypothetical protein
MQVEHCLLLHLTNCPFPPQVYRNISCSPPILLVSNEPIPLVNKTKAPQMTAVPINNMIKVCEESTWDYTITSRIKDFRSASRFISYIYRYRNVLPYPQRLTTNIYPELHEFNPHPYPIPLRPLLILPSYTRFPRRKGQYSVRS